MQILLVAATGIRTSDAPFLLADALRRSGASVEFLPVDDGLPALAYVGWSRRRHRDGVYRTWFQTRVRGLARRLRPDLVLIYGSNWSLDPETIEYLRRRIGCQVVLWEVNQRLFGDSQARCLPLYDHVFCIDSYYVPVLRSGGLTCAEYLAAAADPREHRPLTLSAEELERHRADLAFVGSYHPRRAEILAGFGDANLRIRIYGRGWEQAGSPVAGWVSDEPVYGRKKSVLYCASRLSFHERGPHMISGENFRVFEVGACAGVTVARPNPGLLSCFEPDEEVLVYEDPAELPGLAEGWLKDPVGLEEIGRAARRRVLAEHTYDHRARAICEHVAAARH